MGRKTSENFEPMQRTKYGNGDASAANKGKVKRRLKADRRLGKRR